MLVQYLLVGFEPSGSALKKQYEVKLIREDDLDGRGALQFTLVPKSQEVAEIVPVIMLWIDETSWLPAQLVIRHRTGGLQVTVRYGEMTSQDDEPADVFRADWPDGTEIVRRSAGR